MGYYTESFVLFYLLSIETNVELGYSNMKNPYVSRLLETRTKVSHENDKNDIRTI